MSKKYDGWVVKTRRGELLLWSLKRTKKELIVELDGGHGNYHDWKKDGHRLVKVKLVEVE